jgi:micrococcal nuclease
MLTDLDHLVYFYKAKVNRVIDGDTVDILIDLGFGLFKDVKARFWGINAPEISHPKDEEELLKGLQTKARVEEWLKTNAPDGYVIIKSHNGRDLKQEKFGRWLVEVYPLNFTKETVSLNDTLVKEGLAAEYMR